MKQRAGLGVVVVGLFACSGSKAVPTDAEVTSDVAVDTAIDAAADAAPNAPIDAPPDAPPDAPSASPRCVTPPVRLLDVRPRRIMSVARSGTTLFVTTYDPADLDGPGGLISIDLTTNQVGAEVSLPHWIYAVATDDDNDRDVFGTDGLVDGSIWRLHPGSPPEVLVAHRVSPTYVAADATHVYWQERTVPAGPERIVRRAIAGGMVETVMDGGSFSLHVAGGYVYQSSNTGLRRHLATGSGADEGIGYPLGYPVFAAMVEAGAYYFAPMSFTQMILRADNTGAVAATVAPTTGDRIASLTATTDYFYVLDQNRGLSRVHRATGVQEPVHPYVQGGDLARSTAVVWNNQLYFDADDYNLTPPAPYLLHCVD